MRKMIIVKIRIPMAKWISLMEIVHRNCKTSYLSSGDPIPCKEEAPYKDKTQLISILQVSGKIWDYFKINLHIVIPKLPLLP